MARAATRKYDWRFIARATVVIGLVFAALASSWIGIDAERRGKQAVAEASHLARRVFEIAVRAYELDALQDRIALEVLRGAAAGRDDSVRERFVRSIAALRADLDHIAGAGFDALEAELLRDARAALEDYGRVAAELSAALERPAEARRGVKPPIAPPASAQRVADLMRELGLAVSARAEGIAEDAGDASDRARTLLLIFGGVSLMLALYLAHWLAEALAKEAELTRRLSELARIDPLTGLPNRRVWDEDLGKALDRARRTGRPCSVGMIDLDHFKRYNDTHGHPAGDQLLRDVAQALSARMRSGDLLARYGGEEFAVVLHGCDAASANTFFERLHGAMPKERTFSAGVSDTDGRESPADTVQRADQALYRAKAEGRDRTVALPRPTPAARPGPETG